MHRTTARFWALFASLPEALQLVARKNFDLLKQNPSLPHFISKGWANCGP